MLTRIAALALLLLLCCTGYSRQEQPAPGYLTWSAEGKTYPPVQLPEPEAHIAPGDFPVAGVVSHHLLAGSLTAAWFRELAAVRSVDTFFILSPRHRELGTGAFSLAEGMWKTIAGSVKSDSRATAALARLLAVKPDPTPFYSEHGVSVLIPFIRTYFPGAKVTALAFPVRADVHLSQVQKTAQALMPFFTGKQQQKNFLLISADFSHHSGLPDTLRKDNRSRKFLDKPGLDTWIYANCDNQPGIYTLALLSAKLTAPGMVILFNSNSFVLSGQDAADITSYFFTFLCERAGTG